MLPGPVSPERSQLGAGGRELPGRALAEQGGTVGPQLPAARSGTGQCPRRSAGGDRATALLLDQAGGFLRRMRGFKVLFQLSAEAATAG